jgi:tryptophan synthase alpha subunit
MNGVDRITRAFTTGGSRIKLMTHAVCGFPDRGRSRRILSEMARSGADIIEAQLPFSDPSADGRLIVEANHAALRAGSKTRDCLDDLAALRKETGIPILIMSYLNPIFAYGAERLIEWAAKEGIDGLIVPDCPDDEVDPPLRSLCAEAGLAFVPLIAPTTSIERARELAKISSSPFLYVVTRLGVTGRKTELDSAGLERLKRLRIESGKFTAAGFGIRERAQIEALEGGADCAIVGSALVDAARNAVAKSADPAEAVGAVIRELRSSQ